MVHLRDDHILLNKDSRELLRKRGLSFLHIETQNFHCFSFIITQLQHMWHNRKYSKTTCYWHNVHKTNLILSCQRNKQRSNDTGASSARRYMQNYIPHTSSSLSISKETEIQTQVLGASASSQNSSSSQALMIF